MDLSLHGARTPREGHTGVDGVGVLVASCDKAPQGLQRPGGRALQPGIEWRRLPWAHPGGTVLRERDRLVHLSRLRTPLGERLGLTVMNTYNYLDLVPKGRDEAGLYFPMAWVRHHDHYEDGRLLDAGRPCWPAEVPATVKDSTAVSSCCSAEHV